MKRRTCIFLLLVLLLLHIDASMAHEDDVNEEFMLDPSGLYPITQLEAVGYGSLVFGFLILIILLFHKKMGQSAKKIVYGTLVISVSAVTIYMIMTTIHLNSISVEKGPVHWHADFEIWVCGNELRLASPKGLSNKQGVILLHAHDDNRIHVEGVVTDRKQASLGAFFYAVGGSLTDDGMKFPTDNGIVAVHNGDTCNEKPAMLYVFVNGKPIDDPRYYEISHHETIPPGDRVKFVFTEKSLEEINPNLK